MTQPAENKTWRKGGFANTVLWGGLVFLYAPMVILMLYSFNASKLVTVWGGFSFKWYGELLHNDSLLDAIWTSLQIAFFTASAAVLLGTMAALIMTRFGGFKGRTLFTGMITAPLVMPDVIIGLSLLLLFVQMASSFGWPADRGMVTIWIAHTTFCSAYVTVVVASRLRELDQSIEEAALDLGATPLRAFFLITVPIILPALASAWLLAFTLSLDDLVIASFVTGPNATTLPMKVFSSARLGVSPDVNALATVIILTVSLVVLLAWYISRRAERKRLRVDI
ncbi:putrescine ABC transporter permease PotI [Terasakiispira papahanaumokuakeensis]|uniref:Putrescine ABC transporter permease PotI n=1 Tax=Terasakiispira papahanaumokuakeensis TaxID=197479 RepID=A0A1E2V9F8_9GAMM|nr:ABC transporter permease subunit [Terasakiispira papahanaumokuakeensis]ODC03650.1 putrescine ABC transporter permease PotI [Terasakiispira papahanaumokuakeensis]